MSANDGIPRGQVVHGARTYFAINGVVVGYAQSMDIQQQVNVQDVEVLDDLLVAEHVVTGVLYSGSIELVMLVERALREAGVTDPIAQVYSRPIKNLSLVDRPSGGSVIATLQNVTFTGQSFSVRKGQLTAHRVGFKAIAVADRGGVIDV